MADIQINKGCPDDWKEYKYLRLRALREDKEYFRNSFEEAKSLSNSEWEERLANPEISIFLAWRKNTIVGMAGIVFNKLKNVKHAAKLSEFYVEPKSRGRGISNKLMNSILNEAKSKKIEKIQLFVNTESNSAIKLYEKHGFKRVGFLAKELKVDDQYIDEYLMERVI